MQRKVNFKQKTKINEPFYAGKHPIYQNIMFQTYDDEINMLLSELQKDMDASACNSIKKGWRTSCRQEVSDKGKCQSWDAMLEEWGKTKSQNHG